MEIKKAFEQMKKELKKELGIEGGFVMNKRQIEKRTATYTVCNAIPYDEDILFHVNSDAKVQSYESWTAEEKANSHAHTMEWIEWLTEEKAKYGTKENKVSQTKEAILNSKAFKNFEEAIGNPVTLITELDDSFCYRLRFYY